jgi:internalin A
MLRKFITTLLILLLACGVVSAQDEQDAYEIALQRIEEARVSGVTELDLSNLALTELPPEIGNLSGLLVLSVEMNMLETLPRELANLEELLALDLGNNAFQTVPSVVWQLRTLKVLNLEMNRLGSLPPEIGSLTHLEELRLYKNQLSILPQELIHLESLCYLDIQYNVFVYLPNFLGQMPKLYGDLACPFPQGLFAYGNPLISPPPEVVEQGGVAILDYLRNEAWWHLQRLIVGGATFTGILAATVLGLRWKNRRGKGKKKNGEMA